MTRPLIDEPAGPYIEISRADWAKLAATHEAPLTNQTLERLRGTGDPTSMQDVEDVYVPLCELIQLYVRGTGELWDSTNGYLGRRVGRTPFVIGVAGSVAVGKSTTARLLQNLLAADPATPRVDLITTDGFLFANAELTKRGLLDRKGFPESYDRRALLSFVQAVKSGASRVEAPVYSHLVYDITEERIVVERPDILIVEGLNVLQPASARADGTAKAISDFFDFSVYVDAADEAVREWFVERFLELRRTAFRDPQSFFHQFTALSEPDALAFARQVWDDINGPNLAHNISPTRGRATAILRKGPDHSIQAVRIRKL